MLPLVLTSQILGLGVMQPDLAAIPQHRMIGFDLVNVVLNKLAPQISAAIAAEYHQG